MARFFYAAREDPSEVIDLIAHRYGWSLNEIKSMPVTDMRPLLETVIIQERDKRIREQWLALLPLMQMNVIKYISEEDYKIRVSGGDIDQRPASEILAEVQAIRKEIGEK